MKRSKIFFVGIKGVAMTNLALIYKQFGYEVAGSDINKKFITDEWLAKNHIAVFNIEDDLPENIDIVVYAAGHKGSKGKQVLQAIDRNIKIIHQAELVAELMQQYENSIAVCGCHGKTTTTTILAHCLINLQVKPGYLIGTSNFGNLLAGSAGEFNYFVFEADEYGLEPPYNIQPKLDFYQPNLAVCTSIDFDHPDVYPSLEATQDTFLRFFRRINERRGMIFCNGDDQNIAAIVGKLPKSSYLTYGLSESCDYQIKDVTYHKEGIKFKINGHDGLIDSFEFSAYGGHNAVNATGAIVALLYCGFHPQQIKQALVGFKSPKRRFELLAQVGHNLIFDDYAHHPAEIIATIKAAQAHFQGRRIIIIFQPHTFSRTQALKDDFVSALTKAGYTLIVPIFASAREQISKGAITAHDLECLARQGGKHNLSACDSFDEAVEKLIKVVYPQDIIFTMGAGEVYELKDQIISALQRKFS